MTMPLRPACVLAALLLLASQASAQTPAAEPVRGKVLLLDNDRILEGDIEKIDGQYRIRRSVGELWIPFGRSKRLCKDLDDAFELMKKQANLKDADERLRLARWCHMNGLKDHALQEAKIALDMRPDHSESLKLVQMLQRFAISASPALATQYPASPTPPARPPIVVKPLLEVSTESFAIFSTRVQPILMNTCVSCHSNGKGGGFQLLRANEGGARASAQANLAVTLEFINAEKPVLSPLLIKSVVAHGNATQAPLKGRQTVPFQTLQAWVDQLIEGNPHLKELRHAEAAGAPHTPTVPASSTSAKKDYFNEVFATERPPTLPPVPSAPSIDSRKPEIVSRPLVLPAVSTPPVAAPALTPMPRDPFDPAEFNARPK